MRSLGRGEEKEVCTYGVRPFRKPLMYVQTYASVSLYFANSSSTSLVKSFLAVIIKPLYYVMEYIQ